MGGDTIINILYKNKDRLKNVNTIIIDAHSLVSEARRKICALGFIISDEKILNEDGIYYEIIKFIRSDIATLNDNDIEFGPILRSEKCQCFKDKYNSRINEINNLLTKNKLPEDKINALTAEKERINKILS